MVVWRSDRISKQIRTLLADPPRFTWVPSPRSTPTLAPTHERLTHLTLRIINCICIRLLESYKICTQSDRFFWQIILHRNLHKSNTLTMSTSDRNTSSQLAAMDELSNVTVDTGLVTMENVSAQGLASATGTARVLWKHWLVFPPELEQAHAIVDSVCVARVWLHSTSLCESE